jgi:hypothetical protein
LHGQYTAQQSTGTYFQKEGREGKIPELWQNLNFPGALGGLAATDDFDWEDNISLHVSGAKLVVHVGVHDVVHANKNIAPREIPASKSCGACQKKYRT